MLHRDYHLAQSNTSMIPNIWDLIVAAIVFGLLATIGWGLSQMTNPFVVEQEIVISLEPHNLPKYAASTVLRMFIALLFSLLFTFSLAPLAAKNKLAEKFIIPFIDIMQSLPVLGLLSITVIGFIRLFPNSRIGPECAAIFAIFTSQVWNMVLSLYQSLKTTPIDLQEVAKLYKLSGWQKFWRIEVPFSVQGLLWNTMVSMSAGWFFVVLSEAISVYDTTITLPGVGSYIHKAIEDANLQAMFYAIFAMFVVILLYDQLLFRPLLAWADKFTMEIDEGDHLTESWFFNLLAKTQLLKRVNMLCAIIGDLWINKPSHIFKNKRSIFTKSYTKKTSTFLWYLALAALLVLSVIELIALIYNSIALNEIFDVAFLGLITASKVVILILLASVIWIPIGVYIGLHERATMFVQPIIQFIAAFPANFFYPLFVFVILKYDLDRNIWTMPLMILGTQWYILFNVISGTKILSHEIKLAAMSFRVKGWLWWKKVMLPAIFPSFVTGAMAAAGGCWNASIVAEFLKWGDKTISSIGLGNYITQQSLAGDIPRITLGLVIMSIYVMLFNRLVWQKLYDLACSRFGAN